jgi:DNA-binding transcriptional MerR regulator
MTLKTSKTVDDETAHDFLDAHRKDSSEEVYGIADLAREFDVTPRAIRLYEEKGLLSPRRINGVRIFSRRDRARLALILRAKAVGSTLEEIKEYLDLYGEHGEGRRKQLEFVVDKTKAAIAELEAKKAHIEKTLAELKIIHENSKRQLQERLKRKG